MTTEPQWSEWETHTPGPCPVPVGVLMQAITYGIDRKETLRQGVLSVKASKAGNWTAISPDGPFKVILRYRYRISPHLIEMRQRAADLIPAKSTVTV